MATVVNDASEKDFFALTATIDSRTRYVRVFVEKPDGFERLLLGELEIIGPAKETVSEPKLAALPPRPMHVKRTLDQALLDPTEDVDRERPEARKRQRWMGDLAPGRLRGGNGSLDIIDE